MHHRSQFQSSLINERRAGIALHETWNKSEKATANWYVILDGSICVCHAHFNTPNDPTATKRRVNIICSPFWFLVASFLPILSLIRRCISAFPESIAVILFCYAITISLVTRLVLWLLFGCRWARYRRKAIDSMFWADLFRLFWMQKSQRSRW